MQKEKNWKKETAHGVVTCINNVKHWSSHCECLDNLDTTILESYIRLDYSLKFLRLGKMNNIS